MVYLLWYNTGEETVIESIIAVEWVAQCALNTCRIFGKKTTVKLKEKEIPLSVLEQYSAELRKESQVIIAYRNPKRYKKLSLGRTVLDSFYLTPQIKERRFMFGERLKILTRGEDELSNGWLKTRVRKTFNWRILRY